MARLVQPELSFELFCDERDRCMDRSYISPLPVLRHCSLGNTNRMDDVASKELSHACGVHPRFGQAASATCVAMRLAGSPREDLKPGQSGAKVIMAKALGEKNGFRDYLNHIPFSNRYTSVMSKAKVSEAVPRVAKLLTKRTHATSLSSLAFRINRYLKRGSRTVRNREFHSLQIACDLHSMSLMTVKDTTDCPLALGSRRGLRHVKRWEDASATIASLSRAIGRPTHSIQTALCNYDKFVRKSQPGAKIHKPR